MSLLRYFELGALGVDLIQQAQDVSVGTLMSRGATAAEARSVLQLHQVYFEATSFSARQAQARDAARNNHHSLTTLKKIENLSRKAHGANKRWKLRVKLCRAQERDFSQITREFLESTGVTGPKAGVKIIRRKQGNHTLSITADSLDIADYKAILDSTNPKDLLGAVKSVFSGKHAGHAPVITTNVIIPLDKLDKILSPSAASSGSPEPDVTLELSNGATITGAQLVARRLAQVGLVTLVHPVAGPLNLYRTQRFASSKQREILKALYPRCVWPDCHKPVDECQYHHIKAWKHGGNTNLHNLAPLCQYHNRVNEDDRIQGRGKIIRYAGHLAWQPPWGAPQLIPNILEMNAIPCQRWPSTSGQTSPANCQRTGRTAFHKPQRSAGG